MPASPYRKRRVSPRASGTAASASSPGAAVRPPLASHSAWRGICRARGSAQVSFRYSAAWRGWSGAPGATSRRTQPASSSAIRSRVVGVSGPWPTASSRAPGPAPRAARARPAPLRAPPPARRARRVPRAARAPPDAAGPAASPAPSRTPPPRFAGAGRRSAAQRSGCVSVCSRPWTTACSSVSSRHSTRQSTSRILAGCAAAQNAASESWCSEAWSACQCRSTSAPLWWWKPSACSSSRWARVGR